MPQTVNPDDPKAGADGRRRGLSSVNDGVGGRIVLGAIAGVCGTALMTVAMRALHRRLDRDARYPLPPREITERVVPQEVSEQALRTSTTAAHFGYGAVMGSLVALAPGGTSPAAGAGYGLLVWAGSYLGWLPSMRILRSATRHPAQRNLLMGAVHLLWGASTSLTLRELRRAEAEPFADGPLLDAPPEPPRRAL